MKAQAAKYIPSFVGLVFAYAGVYKLFFPAEAIAGLEVLGLAYRSARWIVMSGIVIELYLGAILLLRMDLSYAIRFASTLLLGFTAYLWYLSNMANPPSCGCVGLSSIFDNNRHAAIFGMFRNCVMIWGLIWSHKRLFGSSTQVAEVSGGLHEGVGSNG